MSFFTGLGNSKAKYTLLLFVFIVLTSFKHATLDKDETLFHATRLTIDWDTIDYPAGTTSGESYTVSNPLAGPDIAFNIDFTGDLGHLFTYPETSGTITPNETSAFSSGGGNGAGGNSLTISMDPPSGTSSITATIQFNFLQENVEFSIYDIDNNFSGDLNTSRMDSVRVIGYAGSLAVQPIVEVVNTINPTFSTSYDGDYGVGVSTSLPTPAANGNEDRGTMDVAFNQPIDRIEIEYLEGNTTGSNPGFRWIAISDISVDAPTAPAEDCASALTTLDWASVSYTAGSLNESITVTNAGSGPDVTFNFELTNDTGHLTNTTPTIDASFASSGGGEGGGGSVLRIDADAPLNGASNVTTTITTTSLIQDVRFSIYDLDSAYTGSATNAGIDSVRILGYSGTTVVVPTVINPNSDPTYQASYDDVYATVKGTPFNPSSSGPSSNDTRGTLDVYFELPINKIIIEYLEANTASGANPVERSIGLSDIQFCAPESLASTCAISLATLDWGSIDYSAGALSGQSFDVTNNNEGGADLTFDFTLTGDTGHLVSGFPDDNSTTSSGGGEGGGGESLEIRIDPPGSASSSALTTTISMNNPATDVRFTIYDIDNSMSDEVQDSVRIVGYNGSESIVPTLIPVNASPTFTITTDDQFGVAVATDPATDDQSNNDTKGSLDVYFHAAVTRIEVIYYEANTGASDFGSRSIGISDISFCSTSAHVISCIYALESLDWTTAGYTSGAKTGEEIVVSNPASGGDVNFAFDFTGNTGDFKDGSPLVNANMSSAGGVANGGDALYMLLDPNNGTNTGVTLNIDISQTLTDVRFSIFDIDNGLFGTGNVNSRQDSVRIIGYRGNTEIAPSLVAFDSDPSFSLATSGNFGIATASDFPPEDATDNNVRSTLDVFFTASVDRVEIEYIEGNVDGVNPVQRAIWLSDIFFCPNEGVLPVTFLDFYVEVLNGNANVFWSTSEELNNDFFSVQRSLNGQVWETIGYVPGAGTTNQTQLYQFTDQSPIPGTSYYRIKQHDFGGASSYTELRRIYFEESSLAFKLLPNPSDKEVRLSFRGALEDFQHFEMVNGFGQIIFSGEVDQQEIVINTSRTAQGVYIVRVHTKAGVLSERVIIER